MILALVFVMSLFVAYSNGANDNFKGVATLFGSNATTYKSAITLATLATLAGAVCSVFLAEGLIKAFSGHGLVTDAVASSPAFLLAVASGAGTTIILATVLGFPVSTTHGLTGALIGAGAIAAGTNLDLSVLSSEFFAPLLISPLLAVAITVALYKGLHELTAKLGITKESCICVGEGQFAPVACIDASAIAAARPGQVVTVTVGTATDCVDKYAGHVFGISVQRLIDACHYLSAGAVSFARGLNDTPKIVALILMVRALDIHLGVVAIAVAMAVGGLLNARKVAYTMSKKIARMNDGQALTANMVTGFLVIFASHLGLPVSTTHVSVGAITGVGIVNGSAGKGVLAGILLSWVLTLPIAAAISAAVYFAIRAVNG